MDGKLAREWKSIVRCSERACKSNEYKFISWNVNGMKAWASARDLRSFVSSENPTGILLQETKISRSDYKQYDGLFSGYAGWFNASETAGYGGTALFLKVALRNTPVRFGINGRDAEGRLITAKLPGLSLVNVYVPNSGSELKRLKYRLGTWDPALGDYLGQLGEVSPIVCGGDMNCARLEIDVHAPSRMRRSAGFTNEERESFEGLLQRARLVDVHREMHPKERAFTYWSYRGDSRSRDKGWRLDYFLLSKKIASLCRKSYIMESVPGSDHCPIGVIVQKPR